MPRKPNKPKCDPLQILRDIASDPEAAAHARVAAAKSLLQYARNADEVEPDNGAPGDAVTRRALRLVKGGRQ